MMFVLDFLSPILAVISGIVLLQFGNISSRLQQNQDHETVLSNTV